MSRDIALIQKEGERERTDIERFLVREAAERDREIALAAKTRELEIAETKRLASVAERERAEHNVEFRCGWSPTPSARAKSRSSTLERWPTRAASTRKAKPR